MKAMVALTAGLAFGGGAASAADWSDTSVGVRYGTKFAEPYNPNDIEKTIVNLTHSSGYKYGTNFFNVDFLMSDSKDSNAQEIYLVYRHTLDLGKVTGRSMAFGPVRGVGVTAGFDANTKNDPGYGSRKRMLVLGPTFMMDVPGFVNVGVYALWESNRPRAISERYSYDVHPMLNVAWGIPVGGTGLSFEGYLNWIAAKGRNEFGGGTSAETNLDATLWYDVSPHISAGPKTFRVGLGYQYWRNKFGNLKSVPGSFAKTPMLRADFHF
ncbi:hypothetical protein GCM10007320_43330 [Pseudorhodoferax aquiterrae]|uniref:Outer envelope protein n=2 Tax=Pseudorhodoferax aquiterrae TaxID=747304 RepID=A0ABQ3G6D2_9BURK|nr:outer envelope protein [Pseudorhodoferax aquiterrae]GHC92851.1 hypothetical protein GCM10007320_43330 [Pseudorhodoferax aquiterrae]